MTTPVFFAAIASAEAGDQIVLSGEEGRHAADVRRLRVGERVDLTDGVGAVAHATVTFARRGELTVVVRDREVTPVPTPDLTVVQALAKGARDEQAVEAMTEIGVDHVIGWEAARCVARWTERTEAKWTATARAASKQSRRTRWPAIGGPATIADVAALCRAADLALILHERSSAPLLPLLTTDLSSVVIVVGPEGGITDEELAVLDDAGGHQVRLGPTVLRSSTAGAVALSVVSAATRWA